MAFESQNQEDFPTRPGKGSRESLTLGVKKRTAGQKEKELIQTYHPDQAVPPLLETSEWINE